MSLFDLSGNFKHVLSTLQKYVKNLSFDSSCPLGKETELKCSCGENLHEFNPGRYSLLKSIGKPRYSKKKRLQKKFLKQWRENNAPLLLTMPLTSRGGFKCGSCGKQESFYSAISKNMIQVQPMPVPEGAKLFYIKGDK